MSCIPLLAELFEYKAWANREIIDAIEAIQSGPSRTAAIRILSHTHVVDQIFRANLQGLSHGFTALNTLFTPLLEDLAHDIASVDLWFVQYVQRLSGADELLNFTFVDGSVGRMTRAEMLAHLINHGSYHRGAAGRILAELGSSPPRDLLTRFLAAKRP